MNLSATTSQRHADGLYRTHLPIHAREPHLRAVLEETLANPGNLTRLRLGILAGSILGIPETVHRPLAVAFEYFHTASLLLDDLPCMDDARERRSRPCAHIAHGESSALLAALAFINRGYALAWKALAAIPPVQAGRCAHHIERCLGEAGVLDGQALDLRFAASDRSPRAVARVAIGKTVCLLRLALGAPALAAGASERECALLDRLAVYWGLAYQIGDDCNDLATRLVAGKTPGRDRLLGRPNFAIAAGTSRTIHRLGRLIRLTEATITALERLRPEWSSLREYVTRLVGECPDGIHTPTGHQRCA